MQPSVIPALLPASPEKQIIISKILGNHPGVIDGQKGGMNREKSQTRLLLFLILLVEKFRLYFSQRSLVSCNCSITAQQTSLFQVSLEIQSFSLEYNRLHICLVQHPAPRNGTAGALALHSPRSWHKHQEPQHSHNCRGFNPPSRWALLQIPSLTNTGWFQPSLC